MYCYTYKGRGIAALVEAMKIPVIEMRVSGQSNVAKLLRYRTDVDLRYTGSLDRYALCSLSYQHSSVVPSFSGWQAVEQ